jgi:transposase
MTLNRLLITSVVVENRPVREVAAQYGVSESWLFEFLARYKVEGESAFEPHSRRPHSVSTTTPTETIDLILELREKVTATGLDASPDTIGWVHEHHHSTVVSRATISRYLSRHGLVVPEPKNKPKSAYLRFQAEQPNETWQSDFTQWERERRFVAIGQGPLRLHRPGPGWMQGYRQVLTASASQDPRGLNRTAGAVAQADSDRLRRTASPCRGLDTSTTGAGATARSARSVRWVSKRMTTAAPEAAHRDRPQRGYPDVNPGPYGTATSVVLSPTPVNSTTVVSPDTT